MQLVINLADALLARGRELWEQDLYDEATRTLQSLLNLTSIPQELAERAQFYLGDIDLSQGHYKKARRHLAAAIATGKGCSETHFLMACACDWDDQQDLEQAYKHYEKAVSLEPNQPLYASAYAMTRIRRYPESASQDARALKLLREAFSAAPDDPDVVYNYISGLIEMGRFSESKLPLERARRTWPAHPAFEELWFEYLDRQGDAPPTEQSNRRASFDEHVVLRFPERFRAVDLRPNARLRTALRTLTPREAQGLAERLGVSMGSSTMIDDLKEAISSEPMLRRLVGRLSRRARGLLCSISAHGGRIHGEDILLRLDGPSVSSPHFGAVRQHHVNELRRMGLVFETGCGTPEDHQMLLIPSDLRRTMRSVLAELN